MIVETPRLTLRPMIEADRAPFVDMFVDHDAMRYVTPEAIPREKADEAFTHYHRAFQTKGYGFWTIEVRGGASFAGLALLDDVKFEAAFTPAIEVGWLLPRPMWGKGYATESARALIDHAFASMQLTEIVALTNAENVASERVMQRLGMTHDPRDDFDFPGTLLRCVLYRLQAEQWNGAR